MAPSPKKPTHLPVVIMSLSCHAEVNVLFYPLTTARVEEVKRFRSQRDVDRRVRRKAMLPGNSHATKRSAQIHVEQRLLAQNLNEHHARWRASASKRRSLGRN